MVSWLPHGFCIASTWLPNDPDDSIQLPDQSYVGSSLAPNVFGTVRVLSGRFPKHSRSCPQRGSLQDRLRKMRKHWRQAGCPDNVHRTMQTVCRRCPKVHFHIQILLWTKILTRKITSPPCRCQNAWKRSGAIRTVKGILQEYADRLPNHADLQILHSASCPGLVRAPVDAWSYE